MAAPTFQNKNSSFRQNTSRPQTSVYKVLAGDNTSFKLETRGRPAWLKAKSIRTTNNKFSIGSHRAFQILKLKLK